jgi:hypothetical protein
VDPAGSAPALVTAKKWTSLLRSTCVVRVAVQVNSELPAPPVNLFCNFGGTRAGVLIGSLRVT